jgi:hypothetical protein
MHSVHQRAHLFCCGSTRSVVFTSSASSALHAARLQGATAHGRLCIRAAAWEDAWWSLVIMAKAWPHAPASNQSAKMVMQRSVGAAGSQSHLSHTLMAWRVSDKIAVCVACSHSQCMLIWTAVMISCGAWAWQAARLHAGWEQEDGLQHVPSAQCAPCAGLGPCRMYGTLAAVLYTSFRHTVSSCKALFRVNLDTWASCNMRCAWSMPTMEPAWHTGMIGTM